MTNHQNLLRSLKKNQFSNFSTNADEKMFEMYLFWKEIYSEESVF